MSAIKVINGIGKGKVVGTQSGDTPGTQTYILPLTQAGGYSEQWSDETITQRLIGLDPNTRTIEEVQIVTDGFGNWVFDYSNLPLPTNVIIDFVNMWNLRSRYNYVLYPKYLPYYGLPERSFEVNLIGQEGLSFITGDSVLSPGTFGVKLMFRTKRNQQISVGIAPGVGAVLPGAGSHSKTGILEGG